jgi:hypothetical protein
VLDAAAGSSVAAAFADSVRPTMTACGLALPDDPAA